MGKDAARLVGVWLLVFALASCGIVVSFDDYGTSRTAAPPTASATMHAVKGTVSGLEGAKVTLLVNGAPFEVGDGPFSSPPTLLEGKPYAVTVKSNPLEHTCSVAGGTGVVALVDATGVDVKCPSTDPSLTALSFSAGALAPPFSPTTLEYSASLSQSLSLETLMQTSLTVMATAKSRGAQVTFAGAAVVPGKPSVAARFIASEGTPLEVLVTAADGRTQKRYTIVAKAGVGRLVGSGPAPLLQFGGEVAIAGDTIAVAAPLDEQYQIYSNYPPSGSVAIYRASGALWTKEALLFTERPGDPSFEGHYGAFGSTLLLDGKDRLFVGAPHDGDDSGAVYVFERTGTQWSNTARILPAVRWYNTGDGGSDGAEFGASLALIGNVLVVGAPGEPSAATGVDGNQNDSSTRGTGAVYTFIRNGSSWAQSSYLKPATAGMAVYFGLHVAVSANHLAVSTQIGPPTVYTYGASGSTWKAQGTLPVRASALAMADGHLVVGSASDNGGAGSVAIYAPPAVSGAGWTREITLVPPAAQSQAAFGAVLASTADRLAVGAPGDASAARAINGTSTDTSRAGEGAVYYFTKSASGAWSQTAYVKSVAPKPTTTTTTAFGSSVALDGAQLAVGAPRGNGAVFVY